MHVFNRSTCCVIILISNIELIFREERISSIVAPQGSMSLISLSVSHQISINEQKRLIYSLKQICFINTIRTNL